MLGLGVAFRVAVKYEPDTDTQFESVSSVLRRDPRMPQLAAPVVLALEQKLLAAIGNYVGITVADLAQAVVQRRRGGDPELIQERTTSGCRTPACCSPRLPPSWPGRSTRRGSLRCSMRTRASD